LNQIESISSESKNKKIVNNFKIDKRLSFLNKKMEITLSVGYLKLFGDRNLEEQENSKKCVICLYIITNRCVTDIFSREFCFQCLRQWSRESSFCPICRQVFQGIVHNFRPENKFGVFLVNREIRSELMLRRNTIRTQLQNIRRKREREIENAQQILGRVDISRIDLISGQNNVETEQTLNDMVRNMKWHIMKETTIDRIINLRANSNENFSSDDGINPIEMHSVRGQYSARGSPPLMAV
jgi:hypothetical protein